MERSSFQLVRLLGHMSERPTTHVQWLLGNNCNYACSYCHEMFRMGDKPFPNREMIKAICLDIIHHYDDLGRSVTFEFIGGEPTLAADVSGIGQTLHNHPVNFVLRSNGSAELDWWKKSRRYVSSVIISVHREFADLDHIEAVIDVLKNESYGHPAHVEVLIPTTSTPESWAWAMETRQRFRKNFGLGDIQLLYANFGRGSNQYYPYTELQWEQYYSLYGKPAPDERPVYREVAGFLGKNCYAGIDTLTIDNSGDVWRGWCRQGGKLGNIHDSVAWPTDSIICQKEVCSNGFDRLARKT